MAAGDESVSLVSLGAFFVAPVDGQLHCYLAQDGTYLADWDIPIHLKPA